MSQDFAAELMEICEEYTEEVQRELPGLIEARAKAAMKALQAKSPKETGSYAKGWRIKKMRAPLTGFVGYVIYNKTDYQLTHLLEFGHVNRDGSFTAPRPHIAKVAESEGAGLENDIRRLIVRGI